MKQGDLVADRFEILSLAGRGGMGVVYQARDLLSGGPVALKVLHGSSQSYASRFAREAQVLADLEHPGIVRHVAHGCTPASELYLVMEWLEGEDLAQRLPRARLAIEECVGIARHAAEALGAAHDRGIVHRDVKPSNLFLLGGDVDRVRLLDFGIVRLTAGTMTLTGVTFGTPGYMAPEQARGDRRLDARADIFALGAVLFECLTGRAAFVGEHLMAVLAKIVLEDAPRVRELRHDAPRALDQLVARMLAKEPGARPRDGRELAAELTGLGSFTGASSVSALPPEPSLTPGEQRLLCVVLAGSKGHLEPTFSAGQSAAGASLRHVRAAVARCDARLECLADGSVIATLTGGQSATDQVAQAARCALAIRAHWPDLPVVLATGRGVMAGRLPVGEAIDRAVELMGAAPRLHPSAPAIEGEIRAEDEGEIRAEAEEDDDELPAIRLDYVSAGLLGTRFDIRRVGSGHWLTGEREMPEAIRTLLGRPTPCVGREREIYTLDATLAECFEEPAARVVLVTAPAGVGKSRLASEVIRKAEGRGPIEIWCGRGDPVSAGSPFGMIAPAVRRAAGVLDGEPLAIRQKKLAARVGRHLHQKEASRIIEFVGELVGVPFGERAGRWPSPARSADVVETAPSSWQSSGPPHGGQPAASDPSGEVSVQLRAAREDAMLMGDQMRRAWEDFLAAECASQPLLIVLEDLHWGDLSSVKLIDAALRHLRHQPFMVLALARPEVRDLFPRLWAERNMLELRLDALSRRACERLARHVLGAGVPAETVSKLVTQSDGNAFYLEELIRTVAAGRGNVLPETVLAMVQARLEALSADERWILRAASVFGQVFWQGGVMALLGGKQGLPLAAHLAKLVEREIITGAAAGRFPGEVEHTFRHSLVREAAYSMLTDDDRMLGHRLAGEWLERTGEIEAIGLAEHFERGGEPERARRWYLRAAEQALGGNDLVAVISRSERGVQNGAAGEELGVIRLLQAEALRWRGEHAEAQSRAVEAMRWLPKGSPRWFSAAGEIALGSARLGIFAPLTDLIDDLCAPGVEVARQVIVALGRVALSLLFGGLRDVAARVIARIDEAEPLVLADDLGALAVIQRLRANRAATRGDSAAYLRGLEAAIACFERAGDIRNACNARANAGHASMELGAYGEAERTLREALATAERLGLTTVAAAAKHNLGLTLMRQGAIEAGRAAEVEAVEAFHAQGDRRLEGASRMYLAMILARAERLEEAEREALLAVELVASLRSLRAAALAVLAAVRLASGRAKGALAAAEEAMQGLEQLGGLEEGDALSRLVHAEALHATGDIPAARAALAAACERLLVRANQIGDPIRRASFLENVPENARTLVLAEAWGVAPGR